MTIGFPTANLPGKPLATSQVSSLLAVDEAGAVKRTDAYGLISAPTVSGLRTAIAQAVSTGKKLYVPAADYVLTSAIDIASLSYPLHIEFDPRARIIGDASLADDFINIANGNDHDVTIVGGVWIADDVAHPSPGNSYAMLNFTYVKGGGVYNAIFQAGATYLDQKYDSAIFCVAENFKIEGCWFTGFWDSAIYSSGSSSGTRSYGVHVSCCDFYGCEVGFISKRLAEAAQVDNCTFHKCHVGVATGSAAGQQPAGIKMIVAANSFDDCGTPVYLEWADGSIVSNNRIFGWGHGADNALIVGTIGAIRLLGTQGASIIGNRIKPSSLGVDTNMHGIMMQQSSFTDSLSVTTTKECLYNTISDNDIDGGAGCGRGIYEANSSDHTHMGVNRWLGTWTNERVIVGANTTSINRKADGSYSVGFAGNDVLAIDKDSVTINHSSSGIVKIPRPGVSTQYMSLFEDGSGHHFRGTSGAASAKNNLYESSADGAVSGGELGHTFLIAGTQVLKINATGLGFGATTPIAKPTVTGSKGANAALTSLLTALANYGLITDSSS